MNRGIRVVVVITVALVAASIATYAIYQGIQRIPCARSRWPASRSSSRPKRFRLV